MFINLPLVTQLTPHRSAVLDFMKRTLFGIQARQTGDSVDELAKESLKQLLESNLVVERPAKRSQHAPEPELAVTKLGQAAFKGQRAEASRNAPVKP